MWLRPWWRGESGRRWGPGGDGGQVTQGLWVEVRTLASSLSETGVPWSFSAYFCCNCPSSPPHSILCVWGWVKINKATTQAQESRLIVLRKGVTDPSVAVTNLPTSGHTFPALRARVLILSLFLTLSVIWGVKQVKLLHEVESWKGNAHVFLFFFIKLPSKKTHFGQVWEGGLSGMCVWCQKVAGHAKAGERSAS